MTVRPESVAARDGTATGVHVEISLHEPPGATRFLHIPSDADVIYVMNDGGDTIDRIYYDARPVNEVASRQRAAAAADASR